jgi:16S rRNA (uracil1498-N3)-methyltransferase
MAITTSRAPLRFYVEAPLSPGADIELPERVARHAAVLRLRAGEEITLFNGAGGEYCARLAIPGRSRYTARIESRREVDRESPLAIILGLGISSGEHMDYAVQKATELGAAEIRPITTERSIVRLPKARIDRRLAHWQSIAAAACEQCGRNRLPQIAQVASLREFLTCPAAGTHLLLSPDASLALRELPRSERLSILIGPEGGFTAAEIGQALQAGFVGVRFGPRILRAETAPLAAIAALQALWGDC